MYNLHNEVDLKLYIIDSLSFNRLKREDYLYKVFYSDYPNMINNIIEKSPLEAGISIKEIVQKAKEVIKFEIEGGFSIPLRMEPSELNIMYNEPNYFINHSLKIMQKLSYLFNTPFFNTYINIKDDDITMIFLYFAIMFKDSNSVKVFKEIIWEDKTVSNLLSLEEKKELELRVFNYIKKYTSSTSILEKLTNNNGLTFFKLQNRLLKTMKKYKVA